MVPLNLCKCVIACVCVCCARDAIHLPVSSDVVGKNGRSRVVVGEYIVDGRSLGYWVWGSWKSLGSMGSLEYLGMTFEGPVGGESETKTFASLGDHSVQTH